MECDRCGVRTRVYRGPALGHEEREWGSYERHEWLCGPCSMTVWWDTSDQTPGVTTML